MKIDIQIGAIRRCNNWCEVNGKIDMKIGVLKENKAGEKRVAIIPSTVSALTKKGYSFFVEKNAGQASNYSDTLYKKAGAKIVEKNEVFDCNIIAKVNSPVKDEINLLKKDLRISLSKLTTNLGK